MTRIRRSLFTLALCGTLVLPVLVPGDLAARAWSHPLNVQARYEEELIVAALRRLGLERDPAPEGKTVESVHVVANPVLLEGDWGVLHRIPILRGYLALNKLHVTTKEHVIRRELLFLVGEPFARDRVEESGRNLRSLFILSVARLVPTRGSRPDRVRMLVVTKDQWSLRLNTVFNIDQVRVDSLGFSISEMNIAGRNKTAAIDFAMDPGRFTVGASYTDPRVWGSRHYLGVGAAMYLRRTDSAPEGGSFTVSVGRPLFSLRTPWAWGASLSYYNDVVRVFRGAALRLLKYGDELIPNVYSRSSLNAVVEGTRSFGVVNKLNVSAGFRVNVQEYGLTSEVDGSLSDAAKVAYRNTLPMNERASGPYLSLDVFRAEYVQLRNINTFALTEDFRVGPTLSLYVRYATPYLGLDNHHLELSGSLGMTHVWRDNLLSYAASLSGRIQTDVFPGTALVNEVFSASLREVTPRFGPFRLHTLVALQLRNYDRSRSNIGLGSSNGLRGFAPRELIGNNYYRVNVELRTVALNLWTVHLGGVVFYDGGDAPATPLDVTWHQDAGVGLRLLIPQFNRAAFRFDLAFPFELAQGGGYAPRFSAEIGQAF